MKPLHYLTFGLFTLTMLAQTSANATNTEFSGNIKAAQKAYPALKKQYCPKGSAPNCNLTALRVISNYAYYSVIDRESGGTGVSKWNGRSWQHLIGGGGQIPIEIAIEAGVPKAIAQILVPVTCPIYNPHVYRMSKDDITGCRAWDLLISRNMIYARKGRPFQAKTLRDYFLSWPWYKPNPHYHDGLLTELEKANATLIMQVEKEKGYL